MEKHPILDDDKFKIGFEFEFVVTNFHEKMGNKSFANLMMSDLVFDDLFVSFITSKKLRNQMEAFLSFSDSENYKRFYSHGYEDEAIRFGMAELIAMFKLKPRWGWFQKVGNIFVDKNDEVNAIIDTVDTLDKKSVDSVARRIKKYRVRCFVIEKYGYLPSEVSDSMMKIVSKEAKKYIGKAPKLIRNYGDEKTKTKPDWYICGEDVDEVKDELTDLGLELVSPPLPPREALEKCERVLEFLRESSFNVVVGGNCGIHVNISHEDFGTEEANRTYFSFLFDERGEIKRFHRTSQDACSPIYYDIRSTIKKLVRNNVVTLNSLYDRNLFHRLIRFIDSNLEKTTFCSNNFEKMDDYGYVEYRMAGGRNYVNRYDDISDHVIKLLDTTKECMKDPFDNDDFIVSIEQVMFDAGASVDDPPSYIETLPESMFKRSKKKRHKSKREHRAKDLLALRRAECLNIDTV